MLIYLCLKSAPPEQFVSLKYNQTMKKVYLGTLLTLTILFILNFTKLPLLAVTEYSDCDFGAISIMDSKLKNCFVLQFSQQERAPLYAIFWKAKNHGVTTHDHKLITSINGNKFSCDKNKKAIYALQPDYSLKSLTIPDDKIDEIFQYIDVGPTKYLENNIIWKNKISPFLEIVEPTNQN